MKSEEEKKESKKGGQKGYERSDFLLSFSALFAPFRHFMLSVCSYRC
jgi:hypothetical protein